MPRRFVGHVQSGTGNASHWLARFNAAYAQKIGMAAHQLIDGSRVVIRVRDPEPNRDGESVVVLPRPCILATA
jgi:hypothetical protein